MRNGAVLEFRRIETADFEACSLISTHAWNLALPAYQRHVSIGNLHDEIENDIVIVAARGSEIIGFASIFEPEWFIHLLFVEPALQGSGIGTALINHVERIAKGHPLSLKCQRENNLAMSYYKSLGFIEGTESGVNEYGQWVLLNKHHQ